jgi:hypothetical protein
MQNKMRERKDGIAPGVGWCGVAGERRTEVGSAHNVAGVDGGEVVE